MEAASVGGDDRDESRHAPPCSRRQDSVHYATDARGDGTAESRRKYALLKASNILQVGAESNIEKDVFHWFLCMATDIIGELSFGESFRMLETRQVSDSLPFNSGRHDGY